MNKIYNQGYTVYGKTFKGETFTVGVENDCSLENIRSIYVAAFLNSDCLWLYT